MKVTRLFDLIENQLESFPLEDSLAAKEQGVWKKYSSGDFKSNADAVSFGLLAEGIGKDDKVAIISPNRPEWNFIDMGVQQIGAVTVPVYPTISDEDYKFIFEDAEVKMVFVADKELYDKASTAADNLEQPIRIFSFEELEGVKHWTDIKKKGAKGDPQNLDRIKSGIDQEDLVTIIYTSGTTGRPKGVMLCHRNIVSNVNGCLPLMPVKAGHKALSFLPLCHIYERMLNYLYMSCGVSVYYAESREKIAENLREIKPQIFVTVPHLLEKVYDTIYAKGLALTGIKRKLFFWALDLGNRFEIGKDQGWWYDLQLNLANKLIFNKWREALGGNIIAIVSGGAALQPRLARIFWAARLPIMEGYGLTETSPVICVNRVNPKENRIGTVGPAIDGVEVKLAEDGEILSRGPHIMMGYYKRKDLTDEVLEQDGWFHTGDIGEWVEGKYLKITDRKKEMFKTAGGKYIAPQIMENKFKESRLIEQIMVIGDGKKFPAAFIIPAFPELRGWCRHKGIAYTTDAEMINNPEVINKFQKEIDILNKNFGQWEKIKKFELLSEPWTTESGELTPTLKVKRKIILENNRDLVDKMYGR